MVSWITDGTFSSYDPTVDGLSDSTYRFASAGSVDVQAETRMQYHVQNPSGLFNQIKSAVTYQITAAEATTYTNKYLTAVLCVVPASLLGANPTPRQIFNRADDSMSYRANQYGNAADLADTAAAFNIDGPFAHDLQANTKYWAVLVPTYVLYGTLANKKQKGLGPLAASASDASWNAIGRAISFWSNRTPAKPVINLPTSGTTRQSGENMNFNYTSGDADTRTLGTENPYRRDTAGIQVQYAMAPTESNPTPVWSDLPIANADATALGRGWYIDRADGSDDAVNAGIKAWWNNPRSNKVIRTGGNALVANAGLLPAGTWQLRMRTLDYGHPSPVKNRPWGRTNGAYTFDSAPASAISPWSDTVTVVVGSQVPPPIPISPKESRAVIFGLNTTLSWLYRNTFVPPYAQKSRTIQIRKTGASAWTTLVSGNSADPTYVIAAGDPILEVGFQYDWRVQVTDAGNVTSDWSEIARFWVVPAPASAPGQGLPISTLDTASLGCGTHRVMIYRRGGKIRTGEITGFTSLDYARTRDEVSTAKVVVENWDDDCGNLLSKLQTWAYEVVIFRDNGSTVDRVWEGPITQLTYNEGEGKVTISARDVMVYAYRRIIKQKMDDSAEGATVVTRATQILQNAFAPDDPSLLGYLQPLVRSDDARQRRVTAAYARTAYEEIDDMASNSGLDYCAVGRKILLWSTKHRVGTLPQMTNENLGAAPIISEYGMSFSNRYAVSDGSGNYGESTRLPPGVAVDPVYGIVETLSSTYSNDTPNESGTYTQADAAKQAEDMAGFADRAIADRYPPPVVVRIPENTTLNPETVISIQQLVPGVVIPLRSYGKLRTVVANQKLDAVKVSETSAGEVITISLSPYNRDDADETPEDDS